ncbi:MAG: prepilin-type N-terminal cleavage/methylation domain-containing protein [Candidatus Saccharibacteria bacterium]
MSLQNINRKQKDHGFTIVELLVVVVVIGILAAITIVSYTGITARANAAKAVSNGQAVVAVAEAINADLGAKYPVTTGEFTSLASTARIPNNTVISATVDPTALTGTTNFRLYTVASPNQSTGGRVTFWDYSTGQLSTNITSLYWGAGNSTNYSSMVAFAS